MTSREKRTREDELFGAVVRRHRLERGLSQERLAEAAGLSQRYLSVLERGENSPTLNVIVRLAAALDLSPAELLDAISRGR
jgi:XRE family transcriptional regulator, regulator of sulfur utilization